jgi:hypothetical protein
MESLGQCQARWHIESIARELTLDGTMRGTRIEALITSCLECEATTYLTVNLHQNSSCPKLTVAVSLSTQL